VEARVVPLYEVEDGVRYRITHWPEGRPVADYLRAQRRYAHLTAVQVAAIQAEVDARWAALCARAAPSPAPGSPALTAAV
jgi:pyruvate ferredoxin oxidoreductase beta subunit